MEIATVVGGALLSVSFEKLFAKLASPELRQFVSKKEVQSELHKWKVMLPMIQGVLEEAEHKETTDTSVKIWVSKLRDLEYDVENVLDEFATEDLRVKHEAEAAASSSKNKVLEILPPLFTAGTGLKFNAKMGHKLKKITSKFETICTQKKSLGLKDKAVVDRRGRSDSTMSIQTTSLSDSHIFGRDKDKQEILDLLLADGNVVAADRVAVIPILGMGGLGKTTLAQQLYNDEKVKIHFQLRVWVCVSDTFDILNITKTILQDVGGGAHDDRNLKDKNLNQLQVVLEKELSGRKFFIVLDDAWNEKYEDWTTLCKPFSKGALGSKIIVTTRNKVVADLVRTRTIQAYSLAMLSDDDCLSLFAQHALGTTNFDGHPVLEDTGRKIVEKCKGLPLVAKTLGGLLRTKSELDEWEEILKSEIWDLPEEKSGIPSSLRLSYHHLPSHLKQCFAYCAMFPKDYRFNKDELVLLWMADGFLSCTKSNKRLEDVGAQHFSDLLSRSLFQPFNEDRAEFVMHDLIHDLAKDVAGEICFHLKAEICFHLKVSTVEGPKHLPTPMARHLSFSQRSHEVSERFGVFDVPECLRTLLALPIGSGYDYHISVDVLNNLLSKLENLRALSLRSYEIQKLPESANGLKHLRYLNLSGTHIRWLPEFVCSLLNLQTLLLKDCKKLEKLLAGIGNIPTLCHLDISGTQKLKEMPVGIGNLTKIRTLGKFIVGKADGLNIRELKNLSQLRGELCLEGLHNVEKLEDAREADLKGKQGLKGLVMRWSDNMGELTSNGSVETEVLDLLQPHTNVGSLAIEFYCGLKFPSWLGDPLLMISMTRIELCNCRKSTSLPSLGRLPMLKHLIIKGMSVMRTLGFEFSGFDSGGFAALETLKFENMQAWEKWCSVGTTRECGWKFPRLHKLEILNCPVLVGGCLVSLPSLRTLKLEKCNESFLKCMVDMGSLTSLSIEEMSGLSCLQDSFGQLLAGLEEVKIYKCEHLVSLWRSEAEIEDYMTSLRTLEVKSCPQLVSLMTRATINKMSSLEKMTIEECPSIQIDQQQERNSEVKLPPKLRHLELAHCGDQFTECLGNGVVMIGDECVLFDCLMIRGFDTLQHLAIKSRRGANKVKKVIIKDCRELVSLSNSYEITKEQMEGEDAEEEWDESIPRTRIVEIEVVEIWNCPSLRADGLQLLVAVKTLELKKCSQLESVPTERVNKNHKINMLLATVREISIMDCPNLKSLGDRLHQLTNLTRLWLWGCDGLETFPEMGLPFPNLNDLAIDGCKNLKSMPNNMQCLTKLRELSVEECGGLESFPGEGSLPTSLIRLNIKGSPNVKQKMAEWKLDSLSSLEVLGIQDFGNGDFKGMLLPTTLRTLNIGRLPKLEHISSDSASSSKCFHLQKNLTTLAQLGISDCPKLRCLPKAGLPSTLKRLWIRNCPIVGKECVEGKGKYWSRISLIPRIDI